MKDNTKLTKDDIILEGNSKCKNCSGTGFVISRNVLKTDKARTTLPCNCLIEKAQKKFITKRDLDKYVIEPVIINGIKKLVVIPKEKSINTTEDNLIKE